jgi:hypothetical protein
MAGLRGIARVEQQLTPAESLGIEMADQLHRLGHFEPELLAVRRVSDLDCSEPTASFPIQPTIKPKPRRRATGSTSTGALSARAVVRALDPLRDRETELAAHPRVPAGEGLLQQTLEVVHEAGRLTIHGHGRPSAARRFAVRNRSVFPARG